ncbi:MAG: cobalamin-dependent protein, partial [Pseudomonadota bacterium]
EDQAKAEIRSLAGRGISFERLQLGLLAPAARKIGVLWEKDELSFVDVNLAVGTLQRLMHFIALDLYKEPLFGMAPKTVCIFPEPGAQHIMGASMAARFFQHSGWTVDFLPAPTERDIRRIVSGRHIDVIGISLNRLEMVDESAALIRRVIRDSQNRDIVAIGGGSAISRAPEVIDELGVDAVFAAIEFAPKQATNLIDERQRKGR